MSRHDWVNWDDWSEKRFGDFRLDGPDLLVLNGEYKYNERGVLCRVRGDRYMHPNQRLLLETLLQLNVESAYEMGCGVGDNLANLAHLRSGVRLGGCDVSSNQLRYLRERHPTLRSIRSIMQADATESGDVGSYWEGVYDVGFTYVAIMHMPPGDHLIALENLFKVSRRYVVMLENWLNFSFMADIKYLQSIGKILWKRAKFYYRFSPEFGKPTIMIISEDDLPYHILDDYSVMTKDALSHQTMITRI